MKTIVLLLLCIPTYITGIAQQRPTLLLVGDSISILYTPYLQADIANAFSFSRKASSQTESPAEALVDPNANGGDSPTVLKYLRARFAEGDFHPDVVMVNCGLHDIKRDPKTNAIAVDSSAYKRNLAAIADLVRSKGAQLVWINTTPVDDARHNSLSKEFYRYNADVKLYNDIAKTLFTERRVPVIDLYTFTSQLGGGHYIDHVHYDDSTRALQAAFIAGFLDSWLQSSSAEKR
jgi:hypothetical protein